VKEKLPCYHSRAGFADRCPPKEKVKSNQQLKYFYYVKTKLFQCIKKSMSTQTLIPGVPGGLRAQS
jgi:hypothetical protein